jgi:sRNA-binding protein
MTKSVTKAETTNAELVVAFPAAFTLDPTLVRPLNLGIKNDIYAQTAISRRCINSALRSYCNSVHYLTTSTEGAMRINLTGKPAGTVTATEARYATERSAVLAKVTAKRASKVASTSTGASSILGTDVGYPPIPEKASNRRSSSSLLFPSSVRPGLEVGRIVEACTHDAHTFATPRCHSCSPMMHSPSLARCYGIVRVARVWKISRASVYRSLKETPPNDDVGPFASLSTCSDVE